MEKRLTIYDIKYLSAETSPYFFSRKALKFFKQTMKMFKVYKQDDERYEIIAPMYCDKIKCGYTERYVNPKTNELERA